MKHSLLLPKPVEHIRPLFQGGISEAPQPLSGNSGRGGGGGGRVVTWNTSCLRPQN